MATLQVRNVPEDLYEALRQLAKEERRSLSQQVLEILSRAVEMNKAALQKKRRDILKESLTHTPADIDQVVAWIREDRDSR